MKRNKQGYGAKSSLKLMLNRLKNNERSYFYLHPFRNSIQRSLHGCFNVHIVQGTFLKTFLNINES